MKVSELSIAIIGTGRLATNLTNALKKSKLNFAGLFGRNDQSAELLAERFHCKHFKSINELSTSANVIIICVSDDNIGTVSSQIPLANNSIILHTSGSTAMDTLQKHAHVGILYPLQSFSNEKLVDFDSIPVFVNGNTNKAKETAIEIAKHISNEVHEVDNAKLMQIHLAAVFASNFSNYMYAIAEQILGDVNVPFTVLKELAKETTARAFESGAKKNQTGPAARNDLTTLNAHTKLLNEKPQIQNIYKLISESIKNS